MNSMSYLLKSQKYKYYAVFLQFWNPFFIGDNKLVFWQFIFTDELQVFVVRSSAYYQPDPKDLPQILYQI